MRIEVKRPSEEELKRLGVESWSPWECEPSEFDWEYFSMETAYILEGKASIKTDEGEVLIQKGDLVRFPKGLKCNWHVLEKIRKVYTFE
jgi:hypothetical protein